jgi:hypothetical protein
MKRLLDRLWMVALLCVAAGLTSRLALAVLASPQSRAQAWEQWSLQVFWYGAALLLFLAHVWRLGTSGRPPEDVPGCGVAVLWISGAVLAFMLLAGLSIPND